MGSGKTLSILGATGSIGRNALRIVADHPDRFDVVGLAARGNINLLSRQIEEFKPKVVSVVDADTAKRLKAIATRKVKIVHGIEGAIEVASSTNADVILSAMVGAAGLAPTLAAVESGATVALANKESMVIAGELLMKKARSSKAKIIPVDSEHSAIFQAMRGENKKDVRKITLTASGGPFLKTPKSKLSSVTIKEALNHPNWDMGPKITIDSATMMNKGLEVIEARWMFNVPVDMIDVLVHPQSVIHSMVEYCDSSVMAQLGLPDMRTPISYALSYPDRAEMELPTLNLAEFGKLTFETPDTDRFPCLELACESLRKGASTPAVLNAANEEAVTAFLEGKIKFTDIPKIVEKTAFTESFGIIKTLADALHIDQDARKKARALIR